jgi:3-oxoacyl-[acyl-carrier-protein] synthase III
MGSQSSYHTRILGTGSHLPERVLSNAEIEKMVETSDQWIVERTGIRERRIASPAQATSDLSVIAAQRALEQSGLGAKDIDMIICATVTPDHMLPNTACLIQAKLGCNHCVAWDLNAACSGFLFSLSVANLYIKNGVYKHILVVGAEVLSRMVSYEDRDTCILFGDGAGAVVLGRSDTNDSRDSSAFLSESLSADGNLGDLLILPAGGSRIPATHEVLDQKLNRMSMKGREIFKNAVRTMSKAASDTLSKAELGVSDITWFIPHQANQRIIEAVAKQLSFPTERIISNVEKTGNTSAASVPIALDEAVLDGRIRRGDLILTAVFGAGLTSGALLLRY